MWAAVTSYLPSYMTGAPENQQAEHKHVGSLGKEQIQQSQSTFATEPTSTSYRTWLDTPLEPIEDDHSLSYCNSQMHQNVQSQVFRGKLNRRVSYIVRPQLSTPSMDPSYNTFPVYEKPHYLDTPSSPEHSRGTKSTKKKKHKKKSKRSAQAQAILDRMNNRLQNIEDRMNHVHDNIHHHRDHLQRMKSHMGKVDNALSSDSKDKRNMYKSWRNLSVVRLSTVSDDNENKEETEDTLKTVPSDDEGGDRRAVMQKKTSSKKSWRSWRKKSNNSMKSAKSEQSSEVIDLDSGKRGMMKRMSFRRKSRVQFEDDEEHEC
ncbi:predicted protein [Chaetoceros tenuissimus]|uniref:Uncharacterized protein n=1 Tax=Chaetoceros tenuissimus TaxID=426638 RepID=A0AAD3CQU6_9STRA|nr:predicted protein [Chaetoceros tenuissimus]